jgi:MFS family permease
MLRSTRQGAQRWPFCLSSTAKDLLPIRDTADGLCRQQRWRFTFASARFSIQCFQNSVDAAAGQNEVGAWRLESIAGGLDIFIGHCDAGLVGGNVWQMAGKRGAAQGDVCSATCFALGFFISYFGVISHQLWLIYFGYGFVGGTGLGLGYISPVSTLIKWFPDRPGLATGMAIMGFGGGAMIGSPLAIKLMAYFRNANDVGVARTFLIMGALYFLLMMFGVFTIRVPREGWKPENWTAPVKEQKLITTHNVDVNTAFRTPQFWLLWIVLCTNVTAGIGILEQASPMIQELFKGAIGPVAAGGFVGLLSLFNMAGRFFWASTSDFIGRKPTYFIFFSLGAVLYYLLPKTGADHLNSVALFVAISVVLLSM